MPGRGLTGEGCMTTDGPNIERRGLLLVLSSPSGAGKTSLARALLDSDPDISLSVSVTTRTPRPGEVDGRDYWFVDKERFKAMSEADELLEWARVFDNFYGTPRAPIEAAIAEGRDVLFDIDWQGTRQLAQSNRNDLVSVFILPPSLAELERRLKNRAQDAPEIVAKRMAKATSEISHWGEYDYVVINHDIDITLAKIISILNAERLKRFRQTGLYDFVKTLA